METTEFITRIQDTLNDWIGGHVIIEKQEHDDTDKVLMQLENFSFLHRGETVDDYTASSLLQLEGKGKIISEKDTVSLPHSRFDIQLEGLKDINQLQNELKITTERAHYAITYNAN